MVDSERLIHIERVELRTIECDECGRTSLQAIGAVLQEAAVHHAAALGVGLSNLAAQGLTWVLGRLSLEILCRPSPGETLEVTTWPAGANAVFARRDFEVRNGRGRLLLRAVSWWLVLDRVNREAVRIPDFIGGIPSPVAPENVRFPRLRVPRGEGTCSSEAIRVLRSDLDFNGHVTSIRYLGWLMEPVPDDIWTGMDLVTLHVQYRAELARRDEVRTVARVRPPAADGSVEIEHALVRTDTGKPAALAGSRFAPTAQTAQGAP